MVNREVPNKKIKKQTTILVLVVVLFSIILVCVLNVKSNYKMKKERAKSNGYDELITVALVDGEPIAAGELKLFFESKKSEVLEYFYNEYGIEYNKDFWTTEIEGEIPIEIAVDKAIEDLTQIKIEQILFVECGIVKDITYESFLKALSEENQNRNEGEQVIYGPEQYSQQLYYNYLHTNRVNDLMSSIINSGEYEIADQEMKSYYDGHKDDFIESYGDFSLEVFSVSYKGVDAIPLNEAKECMDSVVNNVESGITFEEAIEKVSCAYTFKIMEFDSELINIKEREYNKSFSKQIKSLKANNIGDIFDTGQELVLCKCTDVKPVVYYDFDEVKNNIKGLMLKQLYDEKINKSIIAAKVEILNEAYEQMKYCVKQ